MKLSYKTYRKKLRGCWLGKNIGGTLGAPFESMRGVVPVEYYTHDLSRGVLPNDDLDLQLVWLLAAREHGRNLTCHELGEYWLTHVTADYSEYGASKNNLRLGILPPYSGWFQNPYRNSNGAWIRSEIWACLMPCHPELAVKYALEDASVDHAEEGVYAELFTAAIESAAFGVSDSEELIEIGLSYIPKDCATAKAINYVRESYAKGIDYLEVRKGLLTKFPTGFGMHRGYVLCEEEPDIPSGTPGYDAPANIGIMMIGWLYGEGDISKSICIATSLLEDADCTAGTLAALMGIIHGDDAFEEKWTSVIGDEIKTLCIDRTHAGFPATVSALSNEIARLVPVFLQASYVIDENGEISVEARDNLRMEKEKIGLFETHAFTDDLASPLPFKAENAIFKALVRVSDLKAIENMPIKIDMVLFNKIDQQQWIKCIVHAPNDWQVSCGRETYIAASQNTVGRSTTEKSFHITPHFLGMPYYDVVIELQDNARPSRLFLPIRLVNMGE